MSVNVECAPERAGRPTPVAKRSGQALGRPSDRDQLIFERRALGGESLAVLALEHGVSHQRIAQIAQRVEGWIVAQPEDRLARRMRLRCRLRYEAVYDAAMTGFAASRKEEVTVKARKTSRPAATETDDSGEKKELVTTVEERIVRQRHGDPRLLATALKAVEKLERLAAAVDEGRRPAEDTARAEEEPENREAGDRETDEHEADEQTNDWEMDDQATDHYETGDREIEDHETDDQTAVGQEGCQPTIEHEPTSDAASGNHHPWDDDGEAGPTRIALCLRGPVVLIANGGHIEYMQSVAESAFPRHSIMALRGETEVRGWLARPDCGAALIWLEDNLGSSADDGTPIGPDVARRLAARGADCPVLFGQGEEGEESLTYRALCDSGLPFEVVRHGGSGWIRRDWLPALTRLVA
jgi:hypothetical protein